jgi:hypothetical protein
MEKYTLIWQDFERWGWIDTDKRWTDYGIGKVREWLDPPTLAVGR